MKKSVKPDRPERCPPRHEMAKGDPRRAAINLEPLVVESIELKKAGDANSRSGAGRDSYLIHARFDAHVEECHWCGEEEIPQRKRFHSLTIRDLPLHGLPTEIILRATSYECARCGHKIGIRQLVVDDRRHMTVRLRRYIEDRVFKRAVEDLAYDTGLGPTTINSIADELSDDIERAHVIRTPRVLGIDDISINRRPRTVFVDSETGEILALARSKHKDDVIEVLNKFRSGGEIEFITMDMDVAYRHSARQVFPHVPIIFDKFHVVQRANKIMNNARLGWQKSGGMGRKDIKDDEKRSYIYRRHRPMQKPGDLLGNKTMPDIPFLTEVYDRKEDLLAALDNTTSEEAAAAYHAWLENGGEWLAGIEARYGTDLAALCRKEFKGFTDLVRKEELAFFAGIDHGLSNAKVENANGRIRRLARVGRGYSYPVLTDKVLYAKYTPSIDFIECYECRAREPMAHLGRTISLTSGWNAFDYNDAADRPLCVSCTNNHIESMTGGAFQKVVKSPVRERPRSKKRVRDRALHAEEDKRRQRAADQTSKPGKKAKKALDGERQYNFL